MRKTGLVQLVQPFDIVKSRDRYSFSYEFLSTCFRDRRKHFSSTTLLKMIIPEKLSANFKTFPSFFVSGGDGSHYAIVYFLSTAAGSETSIVKEKYFSTRVSVNLCVRPTLSVFILYLLY